MKQLLLILAITAAIACPAQIKRANVWYFGAHAGLTFASGSPVPLLKGAMNVSEGCASMSNTLGILEFYTNGITVWNSQHVVMPNGTGLLGGNSSSQVISIPKPGSNTVYYIFYADHYGGPQGLRYSEVDMRLDPPFGDVVPATKNTLLLDSASEKMTAVNHCNGKDVWLMTVNYQTDEFYAYLITPDSIMPPVISPCTPHGPYCCECMKFSPDGKWLAYTNIGLDSRLFRFNSQTGEATFYTTLPRNLAIGEQQHWGLSFSPASGKLYISSYISQPSGTSARLLQYDMTAVSIPASRNEVLSQYFLDTPVPIPFTHLQNGPDGKMYMAQWPGGSVSGYDTLAAINAPELPGLSCNAVRSAVPLLGRNSLIGLPNYNESYFSKGEKPELPPGCLACDPDNDLSMPNAFSPDGDGRNDSYCLQGWDVCMEQFSIMIFNRWGEKVYESTDPNFCWNGTYKGQSLSTDVFVYRVTAGFTDGKMIRKKGNISLLRF